MYAIRNIRLCTKDCLCLYVCPTGATDTETGQIDASKCTACGACISACPSHAISMMPKEFPPQQPKSREVLQSMGRVGHSKTQQEQLARQLAENTDNPPLNQLYRALEMSCRLMAEDAFREAGYMLAQSGKTNELLKTLLENEKDDDFPGETVKRLLDIIKPNE